MLKCLIKKPNNEININLINEYYEKRKNILFLREMGGFGDILMMRMMFEDIKKKYPDFYINWSIPKVYHSIGSHPYVDEISDSALINKNNFIKIFDLKNACIRHEWKHLKECVTHRSDIWAEHCGMKLENHNMHLSAKEESLIKISKIIEKYKIFSKSPVILLCPFSAQPAKDLLISQIEFILNYLYSKNLNCILIHHQINLNLLGKGYPFMCVNSFDDAMAAHYLANATITVDTGHLHCSSGLNKPTLGIFSYVDGYVYCKYYKNTIILQKHHKDGNWDCGPCWNYGNCTKTNVIKNKPCVSELSSDEIKEKIDLLIHKYI